MTHEGAHLFYLAFRLTLVFIIISYVTLCSTATETLHTDDVPLLDQDEETQQTSKEHLSTSPTLAAGMAYPAQPLPQLKEVELDSFPHLLSTALTLLLHLGSNRAATPMW